VIEFCVRMLRPRSDETVLDPACGSGGFLVHALAHVREHARLEGAALDRYCRERLVGCDISPRAARVARALMAIAGRGGARILRLNGLLGPGTSGGALGETTIEQACGDVLAGQGGFDLVLTNPPFAGDVREPELLAGYALSRGRRRVERDVLFLERCVRLLRPGGRMAIVLPHNKLGGAAFAAVRRWLLRETRVLAVVGLGRHTFLPHTHQKAGVLFCRRRAAGEEESPDERILFAVSERAGKDSKGRWVLRADARAGAALHERVDHDLDSIVARFHALQREARPADRAAGA
jgi:type I restriction enzyme M protein